MVLWFDITYFFVRISFLSSSFNSALLSQAQRNQSHRNVWMHFLFFTFVCLRCLCHIFFYYEWYFHSNVSINIHREKEMEIGSNQMPIHWTHVWRKKTNDRVYFSAHKFNRFSTSLPVLLQIYENNPEFFCMISTHGIFMLEILANQHHHFDSSIGNTDFLFESSFFCEFASSSFVSMVTMLKCYCYDSIKIEYDEKLQRHCCVKMVRKKRRNMIDNHF